MGKIKEAYEDIVSISNDLLYNGNKLIACCKKNDIEGARKQLEHGVSPDVETSREYKHTILMEASAKGQYEIVCLLIRHRANLNMCDNNGNTALIEAVKSGHPSIALVLLQHGADTSVKNKAGKRAIDFVDMKCFDGTEALRMLQEKEKPEEEKSESEGITSGEILATAGIGYALYKLITTFGED